MSKILVEVPEEQREDTVNSLAYEAEARLRDPVYGCIGAIALLQRRMVELQHDLAVARARLARYTTVVVPMTSSSSSSSSSSHLFHGSLAVTGFQDFQACSGLFDGLGQLNSMELNNQAVSINDFSQTPFQL